MKNTIIAIAATLFASATLAHEQVPNVTTFVSNQCFAEMQGFDFSVIRTEFKKRGYIMSEDEARVAIYLSCVENKFEALRIEYVESRFGEQL